MKIKFSCGCSVKVNPDGYGGIDATDLKLCEHHHEKFMIKNIERILG